MTTNCCFKCRDCGFIIFCTLNNDFNKSLEFMFSSESYYLSATGLYLFVQRAKWTTSHIFLRYYMKTLISFRCFDGTLVLWGKLMQNDHVFTHNQYSCVTVGIYFSFQHSVKPNDMWIFCKRILLKSSDGNSVFSRRLSHFVITAVAFQQRDITVCFTTHTFPLMADLLHVNKSDTSHFT